MAEKILKTRTQFSSTLKTELFEKLKSYSELTDIPISKILDRCVGNFFDELKQKHQQDKTSTE